jgi:hypothetical protein
MRHVRSAVSQGNHSQAEEGWHLRDLWSQSCRDLRNGRKYNLAWRPVRCGKRQTSNTMHRLSRKGKNQSLSVLKARHDHPQRSPWIDDTRETHTYPGVCTCPCGAIVRRTRMEQGTTPHMAERTRATQP